MQHDEFIGQVQQRARLESRGSAERVTRATLETLGERLAGGEPGDLAAQLPPEIGLHLRRVAGSGERFDLDEFYRRVTERCGPGTDLPAAVYQAKAVVSVVREAVSAGEFDDVVDQLPESYADLFDYEGAR